MRDRERDRTREREKRVTISGEDRVDMTNGFNIRLNVTLTAFQGVTTTISSR